jgi:hypothetical protein
MKSHEIDPWKPGLTSNTPAQPTLAAHFVNFGSAALAFPGVVWM